MIRLGNLTNDISYKWLQIHCVVTNCVLHVRVVVHNATLSTIEYLNLDVRNEHSFELVVPFVKFLVHLAYYSAFEIRSQLAGMKKQSVPIAIRK